MNGFAAYLLFRPLRITELIKNHFENRGLHYPEKESVDGLTHVITGHEQTHLNRLCHIVYLVHLLPKRI